MLQSKMKTYIQHLIDEKPDAIGIYTTEKMYAEKNGFLPEHVKLEEPDLPRFAEAYLERVNKETEELISAENPESFLKEKGSYARVNKSEFIYIESDWFDYVGAENISFEHDDVFSTYKFLLGLKYKKAKGTALKEYFLQKAGGNSEKFEVLFNDKDGMWDVNFDCSLLADFSEEDALEEIFEKLYSFLFQLAEALEKNE
ncbi:hypothetical protein MHB63_19710 [Bacillus sp. FSL H8-0547]